MGKERASAAVLAGGKSSRMKANKAFLNVGGRAMIERVIQELVRRFDDVFIVANEIERYQDLGVRVVPDVVPGKGPLSGIHAALSQAGYPAVFVSACDIPFADGRIAAALVAGIEDYDCAVPVLGRFPEPLFAAYRKSCLEPASACLEAGTLKVADLFARVRVRYITGKELPGLVNPTAFFNVNYPEDWVRAQVMAGDRPQGVKPPSLSPFITFAGTSNSGKTVLVTRLVSELTRRGFRVGTVKHAPHGYDTNPQNEDKDSRRHFRAGAEATVVVGPGEMLLTRRSEWEMPLTEILAGMPEVDLVLVEGYKRLGYPKVVISEGESGSINLDGAAAVVGERLPQRKDLPVFNRDDIQGLASFILTYLGVKQLEGE